MLYKTDYLIIIYCDKISLLLNQKLNNNIYYLSDEAIEEEESMTCVTAVAV